ENPLHHYPILLALAWRHGIGPLHARFHSHLVIIDPLYVIVNPQWVPLFGQLLSILTMGVAGHVSSELLTSASSHDSASRFHVVQPRFPLEAQAIAIHVAAHSLVTG